MPVRQVRITVPGGAHARPVAELVRLAAEHSDPVTLRTHDGTVVDLSSVLAVMDLALEIGDEVSLETAPSPEADAVLAALAQALDPVS
ncbi:HPr family phosphocarrier protein [Microbacterium sp. GXF6406]